MNYTQISLIKWRKNISQRQNNLILIRAWNRGRISHSKRYWARLPQKPPKWIKQLRECHLKLKDQMARSLEKGALVLSVKMKRNLQLTGLSIIYLITEFKRFVANLKVIHLSGKIVWVRSRPKMASIYVRFSRNIRVPKDQQQKRKKK